MRRLTRLANAFSKKWESWWATLCLYFAWCNFIRILGARAERPAVAVGITDTV
jgi:hypothetical protein